ncbi:MAG TPA: hypothetical protein VNQ76_15805, partial [Planctomicrobium sp.]|nr:hypothetical protein [Planctomicrobium sp.]
MPDHLNERDLLTDSATSATSRLLPLVPFERFLLKSDSPQTPMMFRVVMRFNGPVRRELLSEAFRIAIERQPLLTSCVVTTEQQTHWVSHSVLPVLQWQPQGLTQVEIEQTPIDWIDLRQFPGINARAWEMGEGLTVLLDVHHVCCDGQGARQLISEWWGLYHQLLEGGELKLVRMDPDQLADRGHYRTPTPAIGLREGLRNLYVTIRGRTIQLPKRPGTEGLDGRSDFLCEHPLSIDETTTLRQRAKRTGFTVNDAAVAASFLAFVKCFPDALHPRRYITLLHPVDLRWPSDLKTPACNRVGVSFLRRRVRDLQNAETLLNWVRSEMQYVKRRYVGAEFLRGLALTENKKGLIDTLQHWGYFVPTLQFTGLGDTTRAMHYKFPMTEGTIDFQGLKLDRIS